MASLVADYGISSDSDEDSGDDNGPKQTDVKQNAVNFLTNVETSSDSDSEEEKGITNPVKDESESEEKAKLPNPLAERLPVPGLTPGGASVSVNNSVFVSQYAKAEQAKQSVLEKHVKMTENDSLAMLGTQKTKANKQVCYNFKKGKCRYGKKCKYSHSDEILVPMRADGQQEEQNTTASSSQNKTKFRKVPGRRFNNEEDEDSYMAQAKKKRRNFGVSNSLLPPKKAMQELQKQRAESRPWTMQQ